MPATHDLWGNPIPPEQPQSHRPKPKKPNRFANQLPTDILAWLQQNGPKTFDELMELRLALYGKQTHGQYQIRVGGITSMGEEKILVTGPAGPLLLLSNKSRHFLLRTLCRLRRKNGWPPIKY
jgi:hypothetical protein